MKLKTPKVTLLGAGPGDPELLTIKGWKALQDADVVLYDALIDPELLSIPRPEVQKIYVGKRCGKHSLSQEEINWLLLKKAERHGHVVRLKGGDPFIFGRGHEELTFLKKRGVHVELIPGISTVTSLPLLDQVPLTKRNLSDSFWVLTGTTKDHQLSADIHLALRSSATLVILMGMRKIGKICQMFRHADRGNMPVMIIQNGSRKDKHVIVSSANQWIEEGIKIIPGAPGIIVAGEVVGLHPDYVEQKFMALCA